MEKGYRFTVYFSEGGKSHLTSFGLDRFHLQGHLALCNEFCSKARAYRLPEPFLPETVIVMLSGIG